MFLYLSLAGDLEAAMIVQRWDTSLESNTIMSYSDTAVLVKKQLVATIFGLEGATNMM